MPMKNMEDFMLGVGVELEGGTPMEQREKIAGFLEALGSGHNTLEDLIKEATAESHNFREGLQSAMLAEGVQEEVIQGVFKEAEEVMESYMRGLSQESLEKTAIIGGLLRGLKQPILEGLAHSRGFTGGGKTVEQGVEKMLRGMAPGLGRGGKDILGEMHSGATRMGLGNWLEGKGMTGLGSRLQDWGESAMGRQATQLNTEKFINGWNQTASKYRQQGRSVGGVTPKTQGAMETFKNLNPGAKNDLPGAVPAGVVEKAKSRAEAALGGARAKNLNNPNRGSLGRGLRRGAIGAGVGGLAMGPLGAAVGGLGGLASGTMGTGKALMAGAGLTGLGAWGAGKLLGGGSGVDETGLPANRNQLIPGVGNNWTGALGGALLASLIGNQLGLEGPMSWMLPLLGGVAGYKMLPGAVNSWQDPKGMGVNAVPQIQRQGNLDRFGYQTQP